MSTPPLKSDVRSGDQALFITNMIVAVMGGLSLVVAVAAPFNMGMSSWQNFSDVLLLSAIIGGFPLACATSLALSRTLFYYWRRRFVAAVVAVIPVFLVLALLTWGLVSE
jgi:hypothetical protein